MQATGQTALLEETHLTAGLIFEPISAELQLVEEEFERQARSNIQVIAYIGDHLRRSGGKRVRPALTILSNYAIGGDGSNESSIRMATVMEFLHTATLVHDDVIDKADTRRNRPSINCEFGNQTAVLMGDWLYMSAFETSLAERSLSILDILTAVTRKMTEGELLQLTLLGRTDISEEQYFDVIARKTAYLFSACCEIGALLGRASTDQQTAIRDYGMNLGVAFQLIDDLLDLTRIDRGKVQLHFEIVDAHALLQNVLEICQPEIDRKQLTPSLDLGAKRVHMRADPARLQQIFWNLINNAVKFTPPNGQITLTTSNDSDGQLRVEIADSGMGIEPESLPKIFDAFEQGGRTQLGGLGLGLAISKTLVEAHNGTITAQSAGRNKGSTFTLAFPTREMAQAQVPPAVSPRSPQRQRMRILLVEDHEDTNRSLTNLLRRRGYHVQSALNFQSALELSEKEDFDVLLSDLGLPDGNGIDLMGKISSKQPLVGIALTGFGMEADILRSREVGFQHHLVKPIDLNKLDALIQESAAAAQTVSHPLAAPL